MDPGRAERGGPRAAMLLVLRWTRQAATASAVRCLGRQRSQRVIQRLSNCAEVPSARPGAGGDGGAHGPQAHSSPAACPGPARGMGPCSPNESWDIDATVVGPGAWCPRPRTACPWTLGRELSIADKAAAGAGR